MKVVAKPEAEGRDAMVLKAARLKAEGKVAKKKLQKWCIEFLAQHGREATMDEKREHPDARDHFSAYFEVSLLDYLMITISYDFSIYLCIIQLSNELRFLEAQLKQ